MPLHSRHNVISISIFLGSTEASRTTEPVSVQFQDQTILSSWNALHISKLCIKQHSLKLGFKDSSLVVLWTDLKNFRYKSQESNYQHHMFLTLLLFFFCIVSNLNSLKTLTVTPWLVVVHVGLYWCFHSPPNSDMDYRIFNTRHLFVHLTLTWTTGSLTRVIFLST